MTDSLHRQVWRIAVPMILSGLTVPLLGLVDTALMGHAGAPEYLGAVALGAMIFSFIFWGFGFLRMGTSGLAAQAFGREEMAEVQWVLGRAILLAVVFAVLLWLVQWPVRELAFWIIEAGADVEALATEYYNARIWSAPATLLIYVFLGWFLGVQFARGALYLNLFLNVINIVLSMWFVMGLGWGVKGIAWATVLSEYLAVLYAMFMARSLLAPHAQAWSLAACLKWDKLKAQLQVNGNIFIRTLCLLFCFSFFTAQGAKFGELVLAANALLLNFQSFMAYALDGLAHAAEALVGKYVGAKDEKNVRRTVGVVSLWSGIVALGFCLVYWLGGELIIRALTNLDDVIVTAQNYLLWVAMLPLISVWSYVFDGVFIGATLSRQMRDTMIFSTVAFLLVWLLLLPLENHGLWMALCVFMLMRGLSMAWVWRRRPFSFSPSRGEGIRS